LRCWNYLLLASSVLLLSTTALLLDDNVVKCYKCGDGGDEHFPLCLNNPVTCDRDEVCQIEHGYHNNKHGPKIQCTRSNSCSHDLQNHIIPCPMGGIKVDNGNCEICCSDSNCVANETSILHLEMMASSNLFCPGRCDVNNLKLCMDTGRVCDEMDFCEVRIDHANQVTGHCTDDHNWSHCQQDLQQNPCPAGNLITNQSAYAHAASRHCTHDCCTTNECLLGNWGIHMASNVASKPVNIPQGGSLYSQIHGYCADTFDSVMCQHLKNKHGICTNRLNISMCLDTCGVCGNLNTNACVDVKADCQGTIQGDSTYCQKPESVFECTKSCNLCRELIDSVITSVIGGVTSFPPAVTPPTSLIKCDDLSHYTCEDIGSMCKDTFLGVVCPDNCNVCAHPTTQVDIDVIG